MTPEELTERQRQLLELISSGVTSSKALAGVTGMAPGSIDTTLQRAARTLGVRDRISAATRYQEIQAQKSQSQSQLRSLSFREPQKSALSRFTSNGRSVITAVAKFLSALFRGVPLGGSEHALRWDQITLEILRVALIGIVALSALVLFVLGFFRTFG
ncbi:MAG: hypothetical protein ABW184_05655 [Sphingobium sp.]